MAGARSGSAPVAFTASEHAAAGAPALPPAPPAPTPPPPVAATPPLPPVPAFPPLPAPEAPVSVLPPHAASASTLGHISHGCRMRTSVAQFEPCVILR